MPRALARSSRSMLPEGWRDNAMILVEAEVADHNDSATAVYVEATALDEPRTGQWTGQRKHKKRKRNTAMTAEEVISQAASEGLVLVKSATSVTGYASVIMDKRKDAGALPYAVYKPGGKKKGNFLGCFATAEEAALCYARSIGNTAARVVHQGCAEGTRRALREAHGRTFQCAQCGALVDFIRASAAAMARGRMECAAGSSGRIGVEFEPGDGCSNPASCSSRSRRRDFVKSQAKMAEALRDGQRQLIRQPAATSDKSYERFSSAEARRVGLAVLDGLASDATADCSAVRGAGDELARAPTQAAPGGARPAARDGRQGVGGRCLSFEL